MKKSQTKNVEYSENAGQNVKKIVVDSVILDIHLRFVRFIFSKHIIGLLYRVWSAYYDLKNILFEVYNTVWW